MLRSRYAISGKDQAKTMYLRYYAMLGTLSVGLGAGKADDRRLESRS